LTIALAIFLRRPIEFFRHFAGNADIASAHFDKGEQYLFGQRRPTALRQNLPLLDTEALDIPPFCTISCAAILL
jgi:hypothetical protein